LGIRKLGILKKIKGVREMKKNVSILLTVVCILTFFTLVLFAEETKYDFRKTNWGMSMEEVRIAESLDEILPTLPTFITTKENDSGTVYTIQVRTFSEEEDAQNLVKKLSDKRYQAYVVKGKTLYKVQLGEFKSYKDAQSSSDKMEKDKELKKIINPPGRFSILRYEDYIWGFDCDICYWFVEDKLVQGCYSLDENILHEDPLIEDYEELKRLLTKKYGRPTMDKEEWKDDLAKRNELNRETAINKGCLEYRTGWETSTTKISMVISGYKNENYIQITYNSKELAGWAEQLKAEYMRIQDEEILKDF
jgi:quinol monooxygenase YgiN